MKKFLWTLFAFLALLLTISRSSLAAYHEEPKTIIIPSVNINLPVQKAQIVSDTWEVLEDSASYGESTALPGENGNTVIFSHAIKQLFGSLPEVSVGNYVYVLTDSYTFTYRIDRINSVHPEDISILSNSGEKSLILYTCEGSSDERRFTARATLIDVSPACRYDPPLTKVL